MNKKIFLMITIFIAVSGISIVSFFTIKGRSKNAPTVSEAQYTIELRKEGFYPPEIRIKRGETIKFMTKRETYFWPASDLHPTHGIYPDFDPKEPIEADKSWHFTFTKIGTWRYHDHISPVDKGTIIVTE